MVLTTLIDIDGTMGWVLLLAPVAVLALVAIIAIVRRDRTVLDPEPELVEATPAAQQRHATTIEAPTVQPPSRPALTARRAPADIIATPKPQSMRDIPQSEPQITDALAPSDAAASGAEADRMAELREAEQRFDDAAVARLSLQLARDMRAAGTSGEAVKSHLRRSIILASRLNDDETHAAGRLELGDIMAEEGDLTTACEHWQIARQIYWDQKASEKQADVDQRMIANHCPTDWVLNDF